MVSVQRHLAQLRGRLVVGEQERLWVQAERLPQKQMGALLLTDRRLLFTGMGFVQQAEEAWPLASVRDLAVVPGTGRHALLTCTVLALPERFAGRQRDLEPLAAALSEGEGAARSQGMVGELERLAALRDAGALTEAEFQGAKQRLLG